MKLYVIRHGQTDWNVKEKCQGRTDIELNNTGIKQAQNAKEQLKKYKIDLIICSPLKRTRKTAEIINETINSEIIIDERIIERGYGNLEGKTDEEWKEIIGDNVSIVNYYNLNWNKQNIEPIQDICKRVWEVLDEIKEKSKEFTCKIENTWQTNSVIHLLRVLEIANIKNEKFINLKIQRASPFFWTHYLLCWNCSRQGQKERR